MPNQHTVKMTDNEKKEARRRSLKRYHKKKLADPVRRKKHYDNFKKWAVEFKVSDPEGHKRWSKDRDLRKLYGISLDDYEAMLRNQNGLCHLCLMPPPEGKHLVVDHNHSTGKVRSLLCNKCNLGIGHLKENVDVLRRAIEYLVEEGLPIVATV